MVNIAGREIYNGGKTFIIAEAGINHNGDITIAKRLVDIAKHAGCDAVKFQTFKSDELPFPNITYEETKELKRYCDHRRIIFLSTPHSLSAIDFLEPLVPAYKIASPHIVNEYFVKRIKIKHKPIIASTGSIIHQNKKATEEEVNNFIRLVNHNDLILLYCISEYPCYNFDIEEFEDFMSRYGQIPVGISCHEKGIDYTLMAVNSGACVVEKHITVDDDFECPDKEVSLNPDELKELVKSIREIDYEL